MSIKALATVLDFAPKHWSSATRLVAVVLADHVNHEGHAWPSIDTIAERAGIHVRNVQRHLRQMEDDGWIERVPRIVDGRQRANLWIWRMWITLGGVTPAPPQGWQERHPVHEGQGWRQRHPEPSSTNHQSNHAAARTVDVDN